MPLHFNEKLPDSLGKYLKKLRKDKNLSIQEVADETKIKKPYLEAIEDDMINSLIEIPYARINILKYGRFLKADIDKLMQLFEQQYFDAKSESGKKEYKKDKKWLISGKILSIFAVVIIVGALFYLGFYINENLNLQRDILRKGGKNQNNALVDSTTKKPSQDEQIVFQYKTKDYVKKYLIETNNNLWYRNPEFIKKQKSENAISD